jgi:predicted Ser/Thr protein kinase
LSQISTSAVSSSFVSTIDRQKILGKGTFGIVFEGTWCNLKVAIKRIPIDNVAICNEREESALKMFHHEHVIKLFHVEEDQDFKYLSNEIVLKIGILKLSGNCL